MGKLQHHCPVGEHDPDLRRNRAAVRMQQAKPQRALCRGLPHHFGVEVRKGLGNFPAPRIDFFVGGDAGLDRVRGGNDFQHRLRAAEFAPDGLAQSAGASRQVLLPRTAADRLVPVTEMEIAADEQAVPADARKQRRERRKILGQRFQLHGRPAAAEAAECLTSSVHRRRIETGRKQRLPETSVGIGEALQCPPAVKPLQRENRYRRFFIGAQQKAGLGAVRHPGGKHAAPPGGGDEEIIGGREQSHALRRQCIEVRNAARNKHNRSIRASHSSCTKRPRPAA